MKHRPILAIATIISAVAASSGSAKETLWAPSDFDGAWVKVSDKAKNGCWTNIGEAQTYATDQLTLAGFEVIDEPEVGEEGKHVLLDDYRIMLRIEVKASRWDDGLCVGQIMTRFVGSVIPLSDPDTIILSPIGYSHAWTVWDAKNLNTFVLDHVKNYVSGWVESGKVKIEDQ